MSKPWQIKKEQPTETEQGEQEKKDWDSCGYLTLSKKKTVLSIVIKNQRYVVNLKQAKQVVNDQIDYTLIYEFVGERQAEQEVR
jgi:hypothetical protein